MQIKTRGQKVQNNRLKRLSQKNGRQIYATPRFAKMMSKNKGVETQAFRFILRNFKRIVTRPIIDPKTGVKVERTFTGSYPGGEGITFRVTHGKKSFFLKLSARKRPRPCFLWLRVSLLLSE